MSKCCNSCGVLKCNAGKPSPVGERSNVEWYSQANIERLWKDMKESGDFLICHSTDPDASEYGGSASIKKGKLQACLGATIWMFIHLKVFELLGDYQKYKSAVGKDVAMSQRAMGEAAMSFAMGRADLFGQITIPTQVNEDRELSWPSGFERVRQKFTELTGHTL